MPLEDELCNAVTATDYEVPIRMVYQHHNNNTAMTRVKYRTGHLQVMLPHKTTARSNTRVRALRYCTGEVQFSHVLYRGQEPHDIGHSQQHQATKRAK